MTERTLVRMPNVGAETSEARLIRWLHAVGDDVAAGEPIAELETEKVQVDLESPASGVLTEIRVAPDTEVSVGMVLAAIEHG
jgi:pyruvate/2-oxoglutarate dehydrogenase complex dihydrolipoamide acyltransferase (E2) component